MAVYLSSCPDLCPSRGVYFSNNTADPNNSSHYIACFNGVTIGCVPFPSGFVYDEEKNACLCPSGYVYNKEKKCMFIGINIIMPNLMALLQTRPNILA